MCPTGGVEDVTSHDLLGKVVGAGVSADLPVLLQPWPVAKATARMRDVAVLVKASFMLHNLSKGWGRARRAKEPSPVVDQI